MKKGTLKKALEQLALMSDETDLEVRGDQIIINYAPSIFELMDTLPNEEPPTGPPIKQTLTEELFGTDPIGPADDTDQFSVDVVPEDSNAAGFTEVAPGVRARKIPDPDAPKRRGRPKKTEG